MRPNVPAMRSNALQNASGCSPNRTRTFARCARIDARCAIMFSRMHLNAHLIAPDRSRDAPERSRDAPECLHECARMLARLLQNHRLNAPDRTRARARGRPVCGRQRGWMCLRAPCAILASDRVRCACGSCARWLRACSCACALARMCARVRTPVRASRHLCAQGARLRA